MGLGDGFCSVQSSWPVTTSKYPSISNLRRCSFRNWLGMFEAMARVIFCCLSFSRAFLTSGNIVMWWLCLVYAWRYSFSSLGIRLFGTLMVLWYSWVGSLNVCLNFRMVSLFGSPQAWYASESAFQTVWMSLRSTPLTSKIMVVIRLMHLHDSIVFISFWMFSVGRCLEGFHS